MDTEKIIPHYAVGLLYEDGAFKRVLTPGKYQLGGKVRRIFDRVKREMSRTPFFRQSVEGLVIVEEVLFQQTRWATFPPMGQEGRIIWGWLDNCPARDYSPRVLYFSSAVDENLN